LSGHPRPHAPHLAEILQITFLTTSLRRRGRREFFCADTSDRRQRFPGAHAFMLFHFLKSGLRFFNTFIIPEASDDSPRDSQGRLPKKG